MQAISHVRHRDKYKCVLLCQEKEKQGFECMQPITKHERYHKNFNQNRGMYEYESTDWNVFYEAVYRKVFK